MEDHIPQTDSEGRQVLMRTAYRNLGTLFNEICQWLHKPKREKTCPQAKQYIEQLTAGVADLETFNDMGHQPSLPNTRTLFENCRTMIQHLDAGVRRFELRQEAETARRIRKERAIREAATVAFNNISRRIADRDIPLPKGANPMSRNARMTQNAARRVVRDVKLIFVFMDSLTEEQRIELVQDYFRQYPGTFATFARGLSNLRLEVEEVLRGELHSEPDENGQGNEEDLPLPREWGGS